MGSVAPQYVKSSLTRDQTRVPCIGRWILIHWATREVPPVVLIFQKIPRVSGAVSQELQRYLGDLNDQMDIFSVNYNTAHQHSEFR